MGQAPSTAPVLPEGLGTLPSEGILGSPVGPAGTLLLHHLHPNPYQATFLAKDAQEPPDVPKSPLNLHPQAGIWGFGDTPFMSPPLLPPATKAKGPKGDSPYQGRGCDPFLASPKQR